MVSSALQAREIGFMGMDVFTSVALILATAIAGFVAVRTVLTRVRSARVVWTFIALVWIAMSADILLVDVNFPLAESRYGLSDTPAPVSLAVLSVFLKFASIALIVLGQSRLRSAFPK
jgi:hypothetical protein